MKNLFKNLMLVAVAAMAFTACTEEQNEVNAVKEKVTITFTAGFGEDTRVSLDNSENDKVYEAAWEAGDVVTFAVFEDAETKIAKEVSQLYEVETDGDTAEFTVTFNNLAEGNVIRAYVNYAVTTDYYGYITTQTEWSQKPYDNGPTVYATAEVVYQAGVDYTKLSFKHDYAYGLMTIENLPTEISNVDYIEFIIDNLYTYVYTNNMSGNKVWFYRDEDTNVEKFQIRVVYDYYESECFFSRSFDEEGQFAFKQGRVSRFTVSTWTQRLNAPTNLDASANGKTITLTWDENVNAEGYIVELGYTNGDDEPFEEFVTKNTFVYEAATADAYYEFYVYAYASDENPNYLTSNLEWVSVYTENTDPMIVLSESSLNFLSEGETKTITVTLKNYTAEINVVEDLDWIETSLEGNVLTVTAAANEGDARNGEFTISAGELSEVVTVKQKAFGAAADLFTSAFKSMGSIAEGYVGIQFEAGTLFLYCEVNNYTGTLAGTYTGKSSSFQGNFYNCYYSDGSASSTLNYNSSTVVIEDAGDSYVYNFNLLFEDGKTIVGTQTVSKSIL